MTFTLAAYLLLLALVLILVMLVQGIRGTVDFLSVRNFFFIGFILFQLTSAAMTLFTGDYDALQVSDQPRAAIIYSILTTLFIVMLLWAYSWRRIPRAVAGLLAPRAAAPGPASMLVLSAVFLLAGAISKFVLVYTPYIGVGLDVIGSGYLVLAVAIAAWAAAPRMFNPAIVLPAACIAGSAVLITLGRSAFSRRDVVALVVAMAWGAYHAHWKYLGFRRLALRGAAFLFAGLLLFGAFTATRSEDQATNSPAQLISRLTSTNPFRGLYDLGTGQYTGANSMWIIQSRPNSIPYDTLHTLRYVLFHPIPRTLWSEKPNALGLAMPDQARVRRVSRDISVGPGIIGHIYNDNPWVAFLPYTIFIALFLATLDELVRTRAWSPFVVLPVAVGLGEIVAMPRGEVGLFFVRAVVYIAGCWLAMTIVATLLRSMRLLPNDEQYYAPDDTTELEESSQEQWETSRA